MHNALSDTSKPIDKPIRIECDNQGALKLINTGVFKAKTKHIEVKYHHVHDEQHTQKTVYFHYVSTDANTADLLTKPLPKQRHAELTRMAGLIERPSVSSDGVREEGGVLKSALASEVVLKSVSVS